MKRIVLLAALLLLPNLAQAQTRLVTATQTIDTAAYISGDVMGATAMTFVRAVKGSSKTGYIVSAMIHDKSAQPIDVELWLFSAIPTSYGNDNAAFDPSDTQLLTVLGVISFGSTSRFAANDNAMKYVGSLAIPARTTNNDGDIYGVLVARGAYDADADGAALAVTLGISQD